MATANPFDLLVDDDNDDPSQLIAKLLVAAPAAKKSPAGAVAAKPAANHSPAQAVQEARNDYQRGGGRFGGRGNGRGGRGGRVFTRDFPENENNSNGTNNNGFNGITLGEYEKVLEEKRKALLALKSEERKADVDKDLANMQLLSNKKSEEDIFVKLGAEKEKRKETADKEEKAKKSLNIDGFLKPARYTPPGGWGRCRGRGRGPSEGGGRGDGNRMDDVAPPPPPPRKINVVPAPVIEDVGQFPSLGVK